MEWLLKQFDTFNVHWLGVLLVLLCAGLIGVTFFAPALGFAAADMVIALAPVWVPIFLGWIFWRLWVIYVQADYIRNQETVLLEIVLPRDITKTPLAMEAVFNGFHFGPGETTFINRNFEGKVRPWWSCELVSIGGSIHFYVWTRKFLARLIESRIYAQYPEVEVKPVEDYTNRVVPNLDEISMWGCDFKLSKKEGDVYPIKTYIDYGLDKAVKEEEKTDPFGSVLEFMAALGPNEQLWLQIIIRQTKDKWKERVENKVNELMKRDPKTKGVDKSQTTDAGFPILPSFSDNERDVVKAMERSVGKLGFDCGIRGLYIATKDSFDASNIMGLTSMLKQFNSETLNGFSPTRGNTKFDYPWQDFRGIRENRVRKRMFDAYKRRQWFHPPHKTPHYVLNTEELATIFHFPGFAVQTPTLGRIPSRRAEAPSNLPT